MSADVPVQYYQSIIAIELAVAGALLFQIRYFDKDEETGSGSSPWLRLFIAIVLVATVFGSLEALREHRGSWAAALVTVGLAVSLLPILVKVLPPISRDLETHQYDPHVWVTVVGLVLYVAVVAVVVLHR